MLTASSTSFCIGLYFGTPNNRHLGSFRGGPKNCFHREKSSLEPKKKQERRSKITPTTSLSKHEMIVPNSRVVKPDHDLPPLVAAMEALAKQQAAAFHFPGHNSGQAAPPSLIQLFGLKPFLYDFTALPGIDNLSSPEGPILEAQKEAAKLFGASESWFLVGGTTCGIQAAIMATCSPGEFLILPRNSHKSAISAMILSGAIPKYIIPHYDEDWDFPYGVSPSQVEKAIKELEMKGQQAAAVFVTSPTYHGICSNVSGISQLCHSYGIPLIVDEAHGAHLRFLPKLPPSALQQGADMAIQSTHKVLCSLTQSSMLHVSGNIVDRDKICRCLQILQSTSPSYLLLASLDAATAQLKENHKTTFDNAMHLAIEAKSSIQKIPGVLVLDCPSRPNFPAMDPFRLTIGFWQLGLSGYKADEILRRDHGVYCELVGTKSLTFVFNLGTPRQHIQRLVSGIQQLSTKNYHLQNEKENWRVTARKLTPFGDNNMSLNPRDAFFASKRRVNIEESLGKVCGELICPFPPGIPAMFPGEIISQKSLDYLLHVRSIGANVSGASDPSLSSIVVCDV